MPLSRRLKLERATSVRNVKRLHLVELGRFDDLVTTTVLTILGLVARFMRGSAFALRRGPP